MGWNEFSRIRLVSRKKRQQLTSASGRTQKTVYGESSPDVPLLRKSNLIDAANPASQVSAYCRAVVSNVFPHDTWGTGQDGETNREIILRNIDVFVGLRRFESLSLHTVYQNLKVCPLVIFHEFRLNLRLVKMYQLACASQS